MDKPSEENRAIYRALSSAFGGGKPKVVQYWDNDRKSDIQILTSPDAPQERVSSYATLGLSDTPLLQGEKEYPARVELVGACESSFSEFANVMATAAFCVKNSQWFAAPGIIFPGVVREYVRQSPMHHLMFVPPFLWEALETLELKTKTVAFLLAVPISDAEMRFAEEHGSHKLEDLFEKEQIDIYDIRRQSVV
jgi:hypothetical protein